ncbi:hypothetical protein U9M48_002301 [Paspalum notatum var. saurae]|uniref:Uncharacterized protein n=1 Tax=Paspalum notatum var. saurae TaxID=547442 RepID=A0AAQ3PJ98_PASNO
MRWLTGAEYIDLSSAGIVDQFRDWFSDIFSHAGVINMSNSQIHGGLPKDMEPYVVTGPTLSQFRPDI